MANEKGLALTGAGGGGTAGFVEEPDCACGASRLSEVENRALQRTAANPEGIDKVKRRLANNS